MKIDKIVNAFFLTMGLYLPSILSSIFLIFLTEKVLLFKTEDEKISVYFRFEDETVWLSQEQMALLFGKARSTIAEHIANIFAEGELEQNRTCRKFRQVRQEGSREVEREVDCYNLDVIISELSAP